MILILIPVSLARSTTSSRLHLPLLLHTQQTPESSSAVIFSGITTTSIIISSLSSLLPVLCSPLSTLLSPCVIIMRSTYFSSLILHQCRLDISVCMRRQTFPRSGLSVSPKKYSTTTTTSTTSPATITTPSRIQQLYDTLKDISDISNSAANPKGCPQLKK